MTSGPDDDRRQASEPTFADVMNVFSFESARAPRRRRWGRRRPQDVDPRDESRTEGTPDMPLLAGGTPPPRYPATGPIDLGAETGAPGNAGAAAVRPYAWTRGRTKSGLDLAIEALVSTSQRGREQMAMLQVEHRAVAELCEQTRSVAEVAALLRLPLGVARVLLGDMAGIGVVTVHRTASSTGNLPDLALMERVLSGLRRL
jgi:Protein of unknown function (DUF742)